MSFINITGGDAMKHGKNRFIFLFLLIPVVLYLVFVIVPYVAAMLISLTRWSGVSTLDNIQWRGLLNFQRLLYMPCELGELPGRLMGTFGGIEPNLAECGDVNFWNALKHNFIILLVKPIVIVAIALFFAALFTQGLKGSKFFRVSFFFPQVMSVAIVAVLWSFIYHPLFGLLNEIVRPIASLLGRTWGQFPWLGDPETVLGSVIAVAVWQAVGFYMVLFIAGMQSIPTEFYEAADIDGASKVTQFFSLTIPLLWETLRTAVVFLAIGAMDMFAYVQVLTNGSGGPSRAADVLSTYMYDQAFGGGNNTNPFGYGTAVGVVLLMLIFGLSFVSMRVTQREVLEY
jgi:N-acetylglucosamine transport system permease protein